MPYITTVMESTRTNERIATSEAAARCGYNRISMRIALAQLNPTVGDLAGNVDRMTRASRDAAARGAEVVVFPELSLTGYPPRDLVEKPAFLESCERELERLARETADLGLSVICGYVGARKPKPASAR